MVKLLGLLLCAGVLFSSWAQSEGQPGMKIIHLDAAQLEDVELTNVEDYPFMKVIGGDNPKHGGLSSFSSADGKFQVGLSRYSNVTLQLTDWANHEFMYFLEGQVEITDEDGSSKIYGPGDAIVMPKGFNGTWRQLSPIRKIHVTYPSE
jgi:uncharacterized cupin superfamily protein